MIAKTAASQNARKLICRAPQKCSSAVPKEQDAALTYTLTFTVAADRNWELQAVTGEMPGFDLSVSGPTALQVTHAAKWTKVDLSALTAAGRNCTYIHNPEGGFTYADHTDRLFLQADHEQAVPLAALPALHVTWRPEAGEAIGGLPTQIADIQIAGPPPVRMRIWFAKHADLEPFGRAIFARMVGCPDRLGKAGFPADELLALGVPIRTEVFSLAYGNQDAPLTTSVLSDWKRTTASPADFDVPSGYADLRNTQALSARLGPKGFASPWTMRLSDIRPGYKDAGSNAGPLQVRDVQSPAPAANDLPNIPRCLPATFGSQLGMVTNQLFYDDVHFLFNNICDRLGSFTGSSGTVTINWLDQWAGSPNVGDGTDGLFCLMRDPPTTSPPYPGGKGLLDKLAERQARAALVDGTIGSQVSLPPGLLAQVVNALSQPDPSRRFDSLPPDSQVQLREIYLEQRIGTFSLTYPTSTTPTTTFYGLIGMQLSDIEFTIHIDNTQPMANLDCDNNTIKTHLDLPSARADANIGRWPTGLYFAVLGASGIGCFFVPYLCSLASAVVAAGIFLLSDYAYVKVEISNFALDATVNFVPDAAQVLRPKANVSLNGDVSVWYMSYIPTGIHQLVSFVYSLVGSHTDIVINAMQSQLNDSLNSLFTDTLNLSFPPHFGPVPFVGISSSTDGAPDDFLYLQAAIDAGTVGVSAPYITQVGSDIEGPLLAGRAHFPAQSNDDGPSFRPYGGFAISQNLLNHYINSIWRNGAFNYNFSPVETDQLLAILKPLIKPGLNRPVAHLWPAVTPRTVFTPNGTGGLSAFLHQRPVYAATFFDDVRLCISDGQQDQKLELQFSAEAFTQIGLGAVDPTTNQLDIVRVTDTFLDLYFDLQRMGVKLIHPEVESVQTQGVVFSTLHTLILPKLEPLMLLGLQFALKSRDDSAIPIPSGNPLLQQYSIPGATVDFHLQLGRGNLFAWIGISGVGQKNGLLSLFPGGSFDISKITCPTGQFLRGQI